MIKQRDATLNERMLQSELGNKPQQRAAMRHKYGMLPERETPTDNRGLRLAEAASDLAGKLIANPTLKYTMKISKAKNKMRHARESDAPRAVRARDGQAIYSGARRQV